MEDLNLLEVCRICLIKQTEMYQASEVGVIDKLFECASVQLPPKTLICNFCTSEINKWYSFKQQVLKSLQIAEFIEEHRTKEIKERSNVVLVEDNLVKIEAEINVDNAEIKQEIESDTGNQEQDNCDTYDDSDPQDTTTKSDPSSLETGELPNTPFIHWQLEDDKYSDHQDTTSKSGPPSPAISELLGTPSIHQELKYQCDLCYKSFTSKNGMIWHKQLHSALKVDSSKGSGRFRCIYCPLICEEESLLIDHMRWKHDMHNSSFKKLLSRTICEVCGEQFTTKSAVKIHMQIHNTKKPHRCKICNIDFGNSKDLNNHRATHMPKDPYVCLVCNRTFRREISLERHLSMHCKLE